MTRLVETKAEVIKLGMDLHARDVVVAVQLDGAIPLRAQKMTPAGLLALVRGLRAAGREVYGCYEAGPCGLQTTSLAEARQGPIPSRPLPHPTTTN